MRAEQCGYRINKVVFRGYTAALSLQQMHENAIEARTRLQLEKVTEEQAQELRDLKLERELARAAKRREEQDHEVGQDILLKERKHSADLALRRARAEQDDEISRRRDTFKRDLLSVLGELGVDLTQYLTQGRSDRVIELRGSSLEGALVHLVGDGR